MNRQLKIVALLIALIGVLPICHAQQTHMVAFSYDLNGNRITPNGYKNGKQEGCFYAGGGMFSVKSKNRIPTGVRRISVYNIKGECIIPDTNQDYFFIYYIGDGFF